MNAFWSYEEVHETCWNGYWHIEFCNNIDSIDIIDKDSLLPITISVQHHVINDFERYFLRNSWTRSWKEYIYADMSCYYLT